MADRLTKMFAAQDELQRKAYGVWLKDMSVDDAIEFIKVNVLAATDELHEALGEVDWKPWTQGPRSIREDAFIGELVDVWHFLMNLIMAAGYDAEEASILLYNRYMAKRNINVQRQIEGYDGRSTKCPTCGRALDDPAVKCRVISDGAFLCDANTQGAYPKHA